MYFIWLMFFVVFLTLFTIYNTYAINSTFFVSAFPRQVVTNSTAAITVDDCNWKAIQIDVDGGTESSITIPTAAQLQSKFGDGYTFRFSLINPQAITDFAFSPSDGVVFGNNITVTALTKRDFIGYIISSTKVIVMSMS